MLNIQELFARFDDRLLQTLDLLGDLIFGNLEMRYGKFGFSEHEDFSATNSSGNRYPFVDSFSSKLWHGE